MVILSIKIKKIIQKIINRTINWITGYSKVNLLVTLYKTRVFLGMLHRDLAINVV